jgi:hypothetical protein
MKVITYGIQPKPKPLPNLPLMLADEIMRRHSGWVLVEACKIIAQRLVPDVPQSETSAPPATEYDIGVGVAKLSTPKRRPGRPKGTRKRRWTAERKEAHRLRKEKRIEEIRNNPRAQALMATLSGMTGARQGDGSEKPQVMTAGGQ